MGRIHLRQQFLQFMRMLFMDQAFDQIMARHVLPMHQIFHPFLLQQQRLNLPQPVLHVIMRRSFGVLGAMVEIVRRGHGALF
jgi:hypothetical protein